MNLKRSPLANQNKKDDLDNAREDLTLFDLMKKQKVSNNNTNTVHYRRDLDSLG